MFKKILGMFRVATGNPLPAAATVRDGNLLIPACNAAGAIYVTPVSAGNSSFTGETPNSDGVIPVFPALFAEDTNSFIYGLNDAGNWDRIRAIADNADTQAAETLGVLLTLSRLEGLNVAGTFDRLRSISDNADAQAALTLGLLATIARQQVWNGSSWDRKRTPNIFKSASITAAGATAVWTPAAGKKFRLMGYSMLVASNVTEAGGGNNAMSFTDAAAAFGITFFPYIPNAIAAADASQSVPFVDLGNGYLSALANNTLNFNMTNALLTGNITVNVWGTEE